MVLSRSHFTKAYLEGLYKYTREGCFIMNANVSILSTRYILQLENWPGIAQNDIRYTRFDHEELARVACEAMNARRCTLIEKLEEDMSYLFSFRTSMLFGWWFTGSYNKASQLTLDDSIRVVAHLPLLSGWSILPVSPQARFKLRLSSSLEKSSTFLSLTYWHGLVLIGIPRQSSRCRRPLYRYGRSGWSMPGPSLEKVW